MFDPEKVERWFPGDRDVEEFQEELVVAASDFDQLLELYRAAMRPRQIIQGSGDANDPWFIQRNPKMNLP